MELPPAGAAVQVRVCVVDSGARMDHPDLARNIIKGGWGLSVILQFAAWGLHLQWVVGDRRAAA